MGRLTFTQTLRYVEGRVLMRTHHSQIIRDFIKNINVFGDRVCVVDTGGKFLNCEFDYLVVWGF